MKFIPFNAVFITGSTILLCCCDALLIHQQRHHPRRQIQWNEHLSSSQRGKIKTHQKQRYLNKCYSTSNKMSSSSDDDNDNNIDVNNIDDKYFLSDEEDPQQLHIDDCGSLLKLNSDFYRAFNEKDLELMEKLWLLDHASTQCIHPSQKPCLGVTSVLESWKSIFDSFAMGTRVWIETTNIRLVVNGCTAILTCDEDVYCERFFRGQNKRATEFANKLTATNIFSKVNNEWYISYRHSSYHADSDAAKNALAAGGDDASKKAKEEITGVNGDSDGPAIKEIPSEGGGKKYIIKGNNIADLLGSDIFKGSLGKIDGDNDDPNIIRIKGSIKIPIDEEDTATEDEDDDNNNENDNTIDVVSSSDNNNSTSSIIATSDDNTVTTNNSKSESSNNIDYGKIYDHNTVAINNSESNNNNIDDNRIYYNNNNKNSSKQDYIRQGCIEALRKLNDRGEISNKQKRILLTDIISCSTRGEYSMVEFAYELLFFTADDNNKDLAEEEFADQCRIFSSTTTNNLL